MRHSLSSFLALIKQSSIGWQKDKATVWCAALAYYTIFSLGPLLLLVISIVGLVSAKTSIEKEVYGQMQNLIGNNGANMLVTVIHHAQKPSTGIISTIIGTVTLVVGALGVFGQLQQMLNSIWGVTPKPKSGVRAFIQSRLLNFSVIGMIAFLLLVSLIASTVISGIGTFFGRFLPVSPVMIEVINFLLSFVIITLLFAFILKVLPDVQIKWRNVWLGAIITSLLFTIGKSLIGIYIGHSGVASEYGAAASLVVLLLWVYYSSQILFFGVEFIKAYTLRKEKKIIPSEFAVLQSEALTKNSEKTPKDKSIPAKVASGFTSGIIEKTQKRLRRNKRSKYRGSI